MGARLEGVVAAVALVAALLLPALLPSSGPGALAAETLAADLSQEQVTITTGFTGSTVLFFGAKDGPGEVVVQVIGPPEPLVVRRKERIAGIWINRASMRFQHAPTFYAIAASDALSEVVPEDIARKYEIGIDHLVLRPAVRRDPKEADLYRRALIRNMVRQELYRDTVRPVTFPDRGHRLFRTEIFFPSNVPTGDYRVRFLLLRDGELISTFDRKLVVQKGGISAQVFHFAHNNSILYGLVAIIAAVVAGWGASQLFRRN